MSTVPPRYEPMLATPWRRRFTDPDWVHEVKWDGVRCLLTWDGQRTVLASRNGNDMTGRYPELAGFTASRPCVVDGEIIATDEAGRPSFGRLQGRMNLHGAAAVATGSRSFPVSLVVFDVLYDELEVVAEPWTGRRDRLEAFELAPPFLIADFLAGDPSPLWDFVVERDLEGIVSKRAASPYRPGTRSPDWRKIVRVSEVRAVVGGYLPGGGGRADTFGSLVLGLFDGDRLRWIGNVGTGFDDAALHAIRDALDAMTVDRSPFYPDPDLPSQAVWVNPDLVAIVGYKEWTAATRLRAPRFRGFTDDDSAAVTVAREGPGA